MAERKSDGERENTNAPRDEGTRDAGERVPEAQHDEEASQRVARIEEAIRQARIARVSGAKISGKIAEYTLNKALGRIAKEKKV